MQISHFDEDTEKTFNRACFLCGSKRGYGGFLSAHVGLCLCSNCVARADLNDLGILLGDALLDYYRIGRNRKPNPSVLTKSVLDRIEKGIFKALAAGFWRESNL